MWNDKETSIDLLGHRYIANAIVEIINEQELRPLTIGIHGSWGAGKSSILSLIESELSCDGNTLCVTFNGWLYQGYEDTKSALMESVVQALMEKRTTGNKIKDLGIKLLKRINWLKAAKVGGGLALAGLTGLPPAALFGIAGLVSGAKGYLEGKDKSDKDVEGKEAPEDAWLNPEEATVPAQIHAFREDLKELIRLSTVERLVVLVDDLDRCLPAAVIDILEAIKLFLFVEGTVFVLATDEQMIEYAVRQHFPMLPVSQADYTKHYLEKLVQIPIRVPSLNQLQTQNYVKFLLLQNHLENDKSRLQDISEAFNKQKTTPYDSMSLTYEFVKGELGSIKDIPKLQSALATAEQIGSILAVELRGNPRNIKRFLNTLFLRTRVAKVYGIDKTVQMDALAKLMVAERFHKDFFDRVEAEVVESKDGKSQLIKELEASGGSELKQDDKGRGRKPSKEVKVSPTTEPLIRNWAALSPQLHTLDLRPFIFLCRERPTAFVIGDDLPHALVPIVEALKSGVTLEYVKHEAELEKLNPHQAQQVFDSLWSASVQISDWKNQPEPIKGLFYLVDKQRHLEYQLVNQLSSRPADSFGIWVASNLDFITSENGGKAREGFFDSLLASENTYPRIKSLINRSRNPRVKKS